MQAVGRQYDLSSVLDCNICYQTMTDPVMLGCSGQHNYDRICIAEWLTKQNICPECKEVIDPNKPLVGNRLINLLLDEHRAVNNAQEPTSEIKDIESIPPEDLKADDTPSESKSPEPSAPPAEDDDVSISPTKDQACILTSSKVASQRDLIPAVSPRSSVSAGQLKQIDATMPDEQFFQESFQWHKQQADLGNIDSLFWLGFMYQSGKGVEYSTHDALSYYKQAAARGHTEAIKKLRVLEECERAYMEEVARFVAPLSQLVLDCSKNDLGGKYEFNDTGNELTDASLLKINLALAQNKGLVATIAQRLQQVVGRHKYSKKVDMIPVAEFLFSSCKRENFGFILGAKLVTLFVTRDSSYIRDIVFVEVCRIRDELNKLLKKLSYLKAFEWYKKEAQKNNAEAQFILGKILIGNCGVNLDGSAYKRIDIPGSAQEQRREGTEWMRKAAANGHEESKKMFSK